MSTERAIVSFLQGSYWLRYQQESTRIPADHCTSQERLADYADNFIAAWRAIRCYESATVEVFYNFDVDSLPEEIQSSIAPAPSRAVTPKLNTFVPVPRVMLAEQMAKRKAEGLSTEGKAFAPRVTLTCSFTPCSKVFERLQSHYKYAVDGGLRKAYCSKTCSSQGERKLEIVITLECAHCRQPFERTLRNRNKGGKLTFCSVKHKNQYYREHNKRKENTNDD